MINSLCQQNRFSMDIYQFFWQSNVRRTQQATDDTTVLSLQDIVQKIWQPTEEQLTDLLKDIENGTLNFHMVDDVLSGFRGRILIL